MKMFRFITMSIVIITGCSSIGAMSNQLQGPLVSLSFNNNYDIEVLSSFYEKIAHGDIEGMNKIIKKEIMDLKNPRMLKCLKKGAFEGHLLFLYRYNRYLHGIYECPVRVFKKEHFKDSLKTILISHLRAKQDLCCASLFNNQAQPVNSFAEQGGKVLAKKYLYLWRVFIAQKIKEKAMPDYAEMLSEVERLFAKMEYSYLFPEVVCCIDFASKYSISWTLNFSNPSGRLSQQFDMKRAEFAERRETSLLDEFKNLRSLGSWENFLAMYEQLAA